MSESTERSRTAATTREPSVTDVVPPPAPPPSAWGWIHLIGGVVLIVAGVGVLNRNRIARIVGVVAAGLSALANLSFLSAAPVYALTVITLDVLFIFAMSVHGGEVPVNRGNERTSGFTGPGAP